MRDDWFKNLGDTTVLASEIFTSGCRFPPGNIRIDRPHDSKFFVYSKLSTLESGFKKLRIRMPDSPDTCGRKSNPQRKIADSKYPDTFGSRLSINLSPLSTGSPSSVYVL